MNSITHCHVLMSAFMILPKRSQTLICIDFYLMLSENTSVCVLECIGLFCLFFTLILNIFQICLHFHDICSLHVFLVNKFRNSLGSNNYRWCLCFILFCFSVRTLKLKSQKIEGIQETARCPILSSCFFILASYQISHWFFGVGLFDFGDRTVYQSDFGLSRFESSIWSEYCCRIHCKMSKMLLLVLGTVS